MKLKPGQIFTFVKTLNDLSEGYNEIIERNGQKQAVAVPFALSPKLIWNAAKNRGILRKYTEAREDANNEMVRGLRAFRAGLDPSADKDENSAKLQRETDRVNDELAKIAMEEIEVEGLLKLPADGFNIKRGNSKMIKILDDLSLLIDGEPEFEEKDAKAKA